MPNPDLGQSARPPDDAALIAQMESMTGARVSFGYPSTTRSGGWRVTLRGGSIMLWSVTYGPGMNKTEALSAALSKLGHDLALAAK